MYCKNCGKEISDEARFCPYCGAKTSVMLPEPKREAENFIQTVSLKDENKALPAYKRNRKKKIAVFLIACILLIYAINHLISWNVILPKETKTEQTNEESVTEEPVQHQSSEIVPDPVTKPVTEQVTETAEPAKERTTATTSATTTAVNWNCSTKTHEELNVNSALMLDNNIIWNFSNCTAVGKSAESDIVTETEADYGFIIRVKDDDSVIIDPYDNKGTGIVPTFVKAEIYPDNYSCKETRDTYEIKGYNNCVDGVGIIKVVFSDDAVLTAGVFKENGKLYAVNVSSDTTDATSVIDGRLKLNLLMEQAGITEKDALYTDNIYYPIVPVNSGEYTDTPYWVKESSKIVKPGWTDAHKVMELYNYVVDNFAYDYWVLTKGQHARSFYYNDFSGKYYISKTRVGVCNDFSQVLAIMCRAQGIPALEIHNKNHSMAVVYLKDYGRWLLVDTTADIMHGAYQEDYTVLTELKEDRYEHINRITNYAFTSIAIGNYEDMEKFGIPTYD